MSSEAIPPKDDTATQRGRKNYEKGYSFEDRVAEAYRLLGYSVQHGRLFSGRQIDLLLELNLGDLRIRRAIECKAGNVTAEDLDKFLIKLRLVQKDLPDVHGAVVGGVSFTDQVTAHAEALGVQLTLYRDLSGVILGGPSYSHALIREIEQNDHYLPGLFVEQLIASESTGGGNKAFEVFDQWLRDSRWNQLTMLGDVGTGKSFLCRMLALRLAKEYLKQPTECPLPLLVDLRNADREFSLEGLILTHFANHGLSRATFDVFSFLLAEGRIVLILDGFDEMASKVTPNVTARNFHELARAVKRNAKVLLTCRTHYFKSRTEEEEVVLGTTNQQASDVARDLYWDLISRSGFKIAYLRPFSMTQIEEYVRKACPGNGTAVLAKIHRIYNLAELSQRPLLLEMIVKSIDKFTTLEVNAAQLYQIFTDAWIHRDRWRDVIRPEDKLKFLMALARLLWEQETTSIEYQKLQEYVGSELSSLIDMPQKLVECDGEIRTASFLVRDDRGRYGFAHSSYAEYFLARDLACHVEAGNIDQLSIRRLTNEVVDFMLCIIDKGSLENKLKEVLNKEYCPLLSENALIILYRLRRNLLVAEKGRGTDSTVLQIEMPSQVQMQGAKLAQVSLEGAILHSARFDGADLRQCIASGSDLTDSSLKEALISKGDFHDACLCNVDATGAVLVEVNMQGADVAGCNFTRADLSSSILTARNLSDAIFHDAITSGVIVPPGAQAAIPELASEGSDRIGSAERVMEHMLKSIFNFAKRYASRMGAGSEAEDIASDVVVYLLTNPAQSARLRDTESELDRLAQTLAWRRMANWQREETYGLVPPTELELGTVGPEEDATAVRRKPQRGPNASSFEELPSFYGTESTWSAVSTADILRVLGKSLSREALQLLVARYIEGDTVAEIARKTGLTTLQVVRQLNKARELARNALLPH